MEKVKALPCLGLRDDGLSHATSVLELYVEMKVLKCAFFFWSRGAWGKEIYWALNLGLMHAKQVFYHWDSVPVLKYTFLWQVSSGDFYIIIIIKFGSVIPKRFPKLWRR